MFIFVVGPVVLISSLDALGLLVEGFLAILLEVAVCLCFLFVVELPVSLLFTDDEVLLLDVLLELEDPVFLISFCLNPFIIFSFFSYVWVYLYYQEEKKKSAKTKINQL